MADNKKYYYLKLKDNFYDSEEMILLQNLHDGYLYSDILMKLYLRSLKNNGKLMFKDIIPYTPEALAQVVRHQVGTVKQALEIFRQLELIEVLDSGAIYMLDIQNFIGESSTEADRKRLYRAKIDGEKKLEGQMSGQSKDKNPPKIEIEKEIELEIEKDIDIYSPAKAEQNNPIPYKEICDYLNVRTNSNYRSSSKKTKDLIKARFNEGFRLEDFKVVIDKKVIDWLKDKEMSKYLRPETLFGTKFESYLNQPARKLTTKDIQNKIDFSDF